jgi:cytochrome c oxidase cbb3-type subunit 4
MYEMLSQFAQTWGLVLFVAAFLLVLVYALAPGNRAKFEQARRIPLQDEENAHGR